MTTRSGPAVALRAWQRFHVRLTALYGAAVFVVLTSGGLLFYQFAVHAQMAALQGRIRATVVALAETAEPESVRAIRTAGADLSAPETVRLRDLFRRVMEDEPDIETIYLMFPTDRPGWLVVGPQYDAAGEYDEAGTLYDARPYSFMQEGLTHPSVEDRVYADDWGWSISGYAPIADDSGATVALVGLDVDASAVDDLRRRAALLAIGMYGLSALLLGLAAIPVARSIREPLDRVVAGAGAIAEGRFDTRLHLERTDEFGVMGRQFDRMAEGLEEREFIRETFGRFVSRDVARALLGSREATEQLGGEEREVTVMFTDIRGYSTISENLAPGQIVDLLNGYFHAMFEVVDGHQGCVLELTGDGVLAVFGAPQLLPPHAEVAVRCALRMQERLGELNAEWDRTGMADLWKKHGMDALRMRIGIHTGRVVAGNLGDRSRAKYAVIGDTVNVAARLEQLNKQLGTLVLVSAETRTGLPEDLQGGLVDRGEHRVKGRESPVHVFAAG